MTDTPYALDSSSKGSLLPGPGIFGYTFVLASDPNYWATSLPQDGQPLEDFLQQLVAGVTNLPGERVFPRWQEEPAPKPPASEPWVAVGVTTSRLAPGWPFVGYRRGENIVTIQQHETLTLLTSCYGPRAEWYSGLIRDGFYVGQNQEVLMLAGMGLIEVGAAPLVPEFINQQWVRRVDRPVILNRVILRSYPILSLLGGRVTIDADGVNSEVIVNLNP
jgi:hypothetical protein